VTHIPPDFIAERQEHQEPSEQPCREGETLPPPTITPFNNSLFMAQELLVATLGGTTGTIVTSVSGVLVLEYGEFQDYTTLPNLLIPPGVNITVTSMWVRMNDTPTTNDVPMQLVKNGVKVGPILSFPIGTVNLNQHATENTTYTPGDTIFYSGGDQVFDFIQGTVVLSYTTT